MKKSSAIPIRKIDTIQEYGFAIKAIKSDHCSQQPVSYVHRDDYYIFGFIESGHADCSIDFDNHHFTEGDCVLVIPGQVHMFHNADRLDAKMLIVDKTFVSESVRRIIAEAALCNCSCKVGASEKSELSEVFGLIAGRSESVDTECGRIVLRNLIEAYIGIVAGAFLLQQKEHADYTSRQIELYMRFKNLLDAEINRHRVPSYYAAKMNISTVYLNEIIHKVCGISATEYIKNEIIVMAKRMLCYTSLSVKEIAGSLGFDDAAYFSRLFSGTAGVSPTEFRRNLV